MNWNTIKHIYINVLVNKARIKYIGKDKYIITRFYSSGKKQNQTEYKNDLRHGISICWFKNGSKCWETEYKNGLRHGKNLSWHENGSKQWETEYKNGRKHGKTMGWYEDGTKCWEAKYKNGQIINQFCLSRVTKQ